MNRTDVSLIGLLPVDFGWEIITMVNKAPGSQLLFILTILIHHCFLAYKTLKEDEIPSALQHELLFRNQSLLILSPALSPFLLPFPTPTKCMGPGGAEQVAFQTSCPLPTGPLLPSAL